jgi:hypothetical protein
MKLFEGVLLGVVIGAGAGIGVSYLFTPDNTVIEQVPTHSTPGTGWVAWHQGLVSRFGQSEANQIFILAYNNQSASGIMSDSTTRAYFSSQGLVFQEGFIDAAIDTVSGIGSGIGNAVSGFFKTGKTIVYIMLGGALIATFCIIKGLSSHPEYIGDIAKAAV